MRLEDDIRDWLTGYVNNKEDRENLTKVLDYITWKRVKTGIVVGFVVGFMFAIGVLKYFG